MDAPSPPTDGKECARSTHGEMSVAPAGIGNSRSLSIIRSYVPLVSSAPEFFSLTFKGALTERASPPPAESPETIIRSGGTGSCDPGPPPSRGGSIRKRYAARASCSAHGKGYCGARPAFGPEAVSTISGIGGWEEGGLALGGGKGAGAEFSGVADDLIAVRLN